jgi:hypothetical protein
LDEDQGSGTSAITRRFPIVDRNRRKDLVERLWKYVWFKDPDDNFSLAGELKQLETADESMARRICDELENTHNIRSEAGPLANCVEWIQLRRKVGAPSAQWG